MVTSETSVRAPYLSRAPDETHSLGLILGRAARAGSVVALRGPLGAGKTIFAKGVAEGLGVRGVVNSPTFILMNEHHGRLPLYHVDVYRLGDPEEALAAGLLDESHADGVTVIEWADRLEGRLPHDRLDVTLEPMEDDDARSVTWRATGPLHETLAAVLAGSAGTSP